MVLGEGENFFSREKKPKRRLRYIFSPLVRRSLARRQKPFSGIILVSRKVYSLFFIFYL